jgi:hypothetical protein
MSREGVNLGRIVISGPNTESRTGVSVLLPEVEIRELRLVCRIKPATEERGVVINLFVILLYDSGLTSLFHKLR